MKVSSASAMTSSRLDRSLELFCMNAKNIQLYQRIQDFSIDRSDSKFPFSQRLAKENGWSAEYTQRAIAEYKKFVFLAVVAGHPVTPSEQVDRVWHLHLLYTRSYWENFCPNVLQMSLHHSPTLGGSSEQSKFYDWYDRTLASYEAFFGEYPPTDIWSPAKIRFGRDTHITLVNTEQNWIIPKPNWNWLPKLSINRTITYIVLFGLAMMVTGCQSLGSNPSNPLNFRGPEFLRFYVTIASIAFLLGSCLRHWLRKPDRHSSGSPVSLDPYETAYLTAGTKRAVETAICHLVQRGHLQAKPTTRTLEIIEPLPENSHPLERAIEASIRRDGRFDLLLSSSTVKSATKSIGDRLKRLDLLVSDECSQFVQKLSASPILFVLLLGITKIFVGVWREKPVGFLVILCLVVAIIGLKFLCTPLYRSLYGDRILARLQVRHQHLRAGSTLEPQVELGLALFGVTVLSQDALQGLRQVIVPPSSSSSGGGGSGSGSGCGGGGGGGCGGGGCGGGCGGCGGG